MEVDALALSVLSIACLVSFGGFGGFNNAMEFRQGGLLSKVVRNNRILKARKRCQSPGHHGFGTFAFFLVWHSFQGF